LIGDLRSADRAIHVNRATDIVTSWLRAWFERRRTKKDVPSSLLDPYPPRGAVGASVQGNNDFAVALYRQLRHGSGNLFFSPFSIRAALALAHAGARGDTASEMRRALCFSSPDEPPHLGVLVQRLKAGGPYELAVANSIWSQHGAALFSEYLDWIRAYHSEMNVVDFRSDAEAARLRINGWVGEETRQKIPDLIPPGGVNAVTRLVLVNAIYFKGTWRLQFQERATRSEPFNLADGGTVRAELMHQQGRFGYLKGPGYQAVELAYRGDDLSMLVVLPDRKDRLEDFEKTLSSELLRDCVAAMETSTVLLFLPRFTIRWGTVDLRERLAALGLRLAFDPSRADFSGINGHLPPDPAAFFISAVFHQSFVNVNEEGTEAAAATAARVDLSVSQVECHVFRADHPFVFVIRDRKSGAILFLGRVMDPTATH
jgi:serpin B